MTQPTLSSLGRALRAKTLRTAMLALTLSMTATTWGLDEALAGQEAISSSAALQIQTLESIKRAKTAEEKKIDSRLYLALLEQRNDPRLAALPDLRFVTPEDDGKLAVDIVTSGVAGVQSVVNRVTALGDVVSSRSFAQRRISARVRLENVEALAAMPEVRKIGEAVPMFTHKINTSEGDVTHAVDLARNIYSVTGAGVKICAISDGVDSLATLQASGDLPASVDVLPGQAGSGNEGAAMLEIIHDLAPDAALGFATANPSEAQFAQNILDLAAAGCNVIVDDIIYLDESPFQDGPVAQAVNTVTAAGVLYFSSAGNEGNQTDGTSGTWEGDFNANGTPAALSGAGPVHNFGDGGQSILVDSGGPVVLIWAEHYDLATGVASTDFDAYVMNGSLTTVFDASTNVQDGVGGDDFPVEIIGGGTFTGERVVVAQFAAGATSSVPMFNLIVFRGELDEALATSGATRGHSAAPDAFSVAATPAAGAFDGSSPTGPFPGLFSSANAGELFSSDGPRRIILSPTGTELTPGDRTASGGIVRQKPDITAADGVATAAPGFNPFFGTSAAAPHAAAIAGLLKSAVPSLTPAQVRTSLIDSAIDIETPGVDRDTGAGIVMAPDALQEAGAAPAATLTLGTPGPGEVVGDGDAAVENNEIWNLTLPLTNVGGAPATGIIGVLSSSTPGVTISSATASYGDLVPTGSGNNTTPFRFAVSSAVPCCSTIQFTLTVTYSGSGAPSQAFDFGLRIGSPGTPVTFSYVGPPVPIPDGADLSGNNPGAPAIASLPVAGVGPIFDIDFRIDGTACSATVGSTTVGIDHTFVNDLELTLRSPNGTAVKIINNTDGSGNNLCQVLLDDESAGPSIQSVVTAQAPFTGSFTPNAALSAFDGEDPNGNWQLEVQDFFSADTGNIREFSLIITPGICDAPVLTTSVTATKTVSGTFQPGGALTYTVALSNTGPGPQLDNPGDEFTDVLPANAMLLSAAATSGTAVANLATNTVTWNGSLAASASVTLTINAAVPTAIAGGTTVANQGTFAFDADVNGTNEASGVTDDPATGTPNDPTAFVTVCQAITVTPTSIATLTTGTAVNQAFAAAGAIGSVTFAVTGALPTGLSLSTAGVLSGTPSETGSFPITVTATDANGCTGSVALTLTVESGAPTPLISGLAEGATGAFFDAYLLLANPNTTPAPISVTYAKDDGSTVVDDRVLAPETRVTIAAQSLPGLSASSFAPTVTSTDGLPVLVERSMFWDSSYYAGSDAAAMTPGTQWYFAEGSAQTAPLGGGAMRTIETYLLLGNASGGAANVSARFFTESGAVVTRNYSVPDHTRVTIFVNAIAELTGHAFGVELTSNVPITAERSVYVSPGLGAGHAAAAVPQTSTTWYHAEGATGSFFETYLLLLNPTAGSAQATVRYSLASGEIVTKVHAVPAQSRVTINVEDEDARLAAATFWTSVQSTVPIVSERSMYWPVAGNAFGEGHNSAGISQPATQWGLAEGFVGGPLDFQTYYLLVNPTNTAATVSVTFLRTTGSTVIKSYVVPAQSRVTVWVNDLVPELVDEGFGAVLISTNAVPIIVERSIYWTVQGQAIGGGTNATAIPLP